MLMHYIFFKHAHRVTSVAMRSSECVSDIIYLWCEAVSPAIKFGGKATNR